MCDPLSATAAALAVGGGLAQANASKQSAKAVNSAQEQSARDRMAATSASRDARTLELQRQDMHTQGQGQILDKSVTDQGQPARDQAIADAARDREALYNRATGVPFMGETSAVPGGGGGAGPAVVNDNLTNALQKASLYIQQQNAAKAKLAGWGDAAFSKGVDLTRGGQNINMLTGFRKGSQGAYQFENKSIDDQLGYQDDVTQARINAAPSAGGGMRTLGNLLTGASQVTAAGAANGAWDKFTKWWGTTPPPTVPNSMAFPGG